MTALGVPAQRILQLLLSFVPQAAAVGEPCTPFMELLRWALGRKSDSQVSRLLLQAQLAQHLCPGYMFNLHVHHILMMFQTTTKIPACRVRGTHCRAVSRRWRPSLTASAAGT